MIVRTLKIFTLLFVAIFSGCAGSSFIQTEAVEKNQSVKIFTNKSVALEGIVIKVETETLTLLNSTDKQTYNIPLDDIRRIEKSRKLFDYSADPVSPAEVEKYKTNKNTLGYATGGAIFGGLAGVLVGLPIWLAADNPPPLFVGGATAIVGSIYMARKGLIRDREVALNRVRYIRLQQTLESEKDDESKRIEELRRQKKELEQKLKKKDED